MFKLTEIWDEVYPRTFGVLAWFAEYKLCSSYFMLFFLVENHLTTTSFYYQLYFFLKDNHFWFPAEVLHYQIQNFSCAI